MVSTGSTDDGGGSTDDGGGTPETAVPEKPGRYQRSPAGMVGALIVTVLVILAFVVFRAVNRSDLDVKPERVDYLTQVRFAQQDSVSSRPELVYPARLPSGWYATHVAFSSGNAPEIALSMLTGEGEYVGFVQSRATVPGPADDVRRQEPAGRVARPGPGLGRLALGHLDRHRR